LFSSFIGSLFIILCYAQFALLCSLKITVSKQSFLRCSKSGPVRSVDFWQDTTYFSMHTDLGLPFSTVKSSSMCTEGTKLSIYVFCGHKPFYSISVRGVFLGTSLPPPVCCRQWNGGTELPCMPCVEPQFVDVVFLVSGLRFDSSVPVVLHNE
jgi:hypothetical protein